MCERRGGAARVLKKACETDRGTNASRGFRGGDYKKDHEVKTKGN